MDLWTTQLALQQPGVGEGNVFATDAGGYSAPTAWAITAAGGAVLVACVAFAAANAGRVAAHWLRHPIRSFGKVYLFPWSPAVLDRSPLHLMCLATGFVVLRLLAAANNLLLSAGLVGPLGAAVGAVGDWTSPVVGLAVVTGAALVALAVVCRPRLPGSSPGGWRHPLSKPPNRGHDEYPGAASDPAGTPGSPWQTVVRPRRPCAI